MHRPQLSTEKSDCCRTLKTVSFHSIPSFFLHARFSIIVRQYCSQRPHDLSMGFLKSTTQFCTQNAAFTQKVGLLSPSQRLAFLYFGSFTCKFLIAVRHSFASMQPDSNNAKTKITGRIYTQNQTPFLSTQPRRAGSHSTKSTSAIRTTLCRLLYAAAASFQITENY